MYLANILFTHHLPPQQEPCRGVTGFGLDWKRGGGGGGQGGR